MLLSVFQTLMAGYSRLLPGSASDTALHLLTTPRVSRGHCRSAHQSRI